MFVGGKWQYSWKQFIPWKKQKPLDHVLIEQDEDCWDAYFVRVKDPVAILKMSDPNLQLTICKLIDRGIVEGATHILYETNLENHRENLELFIGVRANVFLLLDLCMALNTIFEDFVEKIIKFEFLCFKPFS